MEGWEAWCPDGARDAIGAAVARAGGKTKAAAESGIPLRTLDRYLQRVGADGRRMPLRISGENALKLMKWLSPDERRTLEICCNQDRIRQLTWDAWQRMAKGLGLGSLLLSSGDQKSPSPRALARSRLCERLRELAELRPLFDDFDEQLRSHGLAPPRPWGLPLMQPRAQLAYERVLGPLLDAEESNGLEPSWEELSKHKVRLKRVHGQTKRKGGEKRPTRLYQFLELGMKREMLLLDQGSADQRAPTVAKAEVEGELRLRAIESIMLAVSDRSFVDALRAFDDLASDPQ